MRLDQEKVMLVRAMEVVEEGWMIGQEGCCLLCASHLSYVLIPDMSVFLPVFSVEGAIIIIEDNNIPIQTKN